MAIGLGRMMGFEYLRNFNYPYIAKSITEFWRRWHISLSSFFRDYVYIPLGGSRVSKARWVLNIAIVWTITGFWHGAAWNYVLWGVYYGVLLICEKLLWGDKLERAPGVLRHAYVCVIFIFGWSFFWITDSSQLVDYWRAMIGAYGLTGSSTLWELTAWQYWPILVICVVASTPIAPFVKERVSAFVEGRKPVSILEQGVGNPRFLTTDTLCVFAAKPSSPSRQRLYDVVLIGFDVCLLILFVLSTISVASGSFNPFIYFQF